MMAGGRRREEDREEVAAPGWRRWCGSRGRCREERGRRIRAGAGSAAADPTGTGSGAGAGSRTGRRSDRGAGDSRRRKAAGKEQGGGQRGKSREEGAAWETWENLTKGIFAVITV